MQRLQFSGAVRPPKESLGVKTLGYNEMLLHVIFVFPRHHTLLISFFRQIHTFSIREFRYIVTRLFTYTDLISIGQYPYYYTVKLPYLSLAFFLYLIISNPQN